MQLVDFDLLAIKVTSEPRNTSANYTHTGKIVSNARTNTLLTTNTNRKEMMRVHRQGLCSFPLTTL